MMVTPPARASHDLQQVCISILQLSDQLQRADDLEGRRVLLRCDLNVPTGEVTGAVTDCSRILASLPVIMLLLSKGAKVAICSHLGRPNPKARNPQTQRQRYTLAPVAVELSRLLGADKFVGLSPDCIGPEAESAIRQLNNGQALLLENMRLHAGETANDPQFAHQLAALADVYVGDAFAVMHRDQASITGAAALMARRYPGPLVAREVANYLNTMGQPRRPLGVAIGGSKVQDKIGILRSLVDKADVIVVGGSMAFTILQGLGVDVGSTQVEEEWVQPVQKMAAAASARGVQLLLPEDVLVSRSLEEPKATRVVRLARSTCVHKDSCSIPFGFYGVDIGPATSAKFTAALSGCNTLLWNGPMGKYEVAAFSKATLAMVETISDATRRGAATCIGGGDTLAAFNQAGPGACVGFASTGGGASLELLEGRALPGLRALL